ncbi:Ig domain-containing protein [Couchioplanes caeruleus]|uniref:Hydrophobic W protein n=1 Tax=Couchioplanes caeruleus subsp. caeruleus TaxID=56427 RepID=A0A1K0GM79_9ACTN|nr:Ig domain-containing protein [Couchioplanes caeruleus]OJF12172.1 hypothetical protein BG844_22055 [Couchioplanes caeruleus subsp. caeruleus]
MRDSARTAAASIDEPSLTQARARVAAAANQRRAVSGAARSVCYQAHVQNIGWQSIKCDGQTAGTTGQSLRMEAIAIVVSLEVGWVCYRAHVQNIGWQGQQCDGQTAGTTGASLRMEAIQIKVQNGSVCYEAHVQNIGWQSRRCNWAVAGTTGQSLRMEAIKITV